MKLSDEAVNFILANAGKMKQKEIAAELNVTPACVCKVLKREQPANEYFNIDDFKGYYL